MSSNVGNVGAMVPNIARMRSVSSVQSECLSNDGFHDENDYEGFDAGQGEVEFDVNVAPGHVVANKIKIIHDLDIENEGDDGDDDDEDKDGGETPMGPDDQSVIPMQQNLETGGGGEYNPNIGDDEFVIK